MESRRSSARTTLLRVLVLATLLASVLAAWPAPAAAAPVPDLSYACADSPTGLVRYAGNVAQCPTGTRLVRFTTGQPPVAACQLAYLGLLRLRGGASSCGPGEIPRLLHGPTDTYVCALPAGGGTAHPWLRRVSHPSQCLPFEPAWRIPAAVANAVDDAYTVPAQTVLVIGAPGVLANDAVSLASITAYDATTSQGGTVVLTPDGSFTYTPPLGFVGTDSFTYTLSGPSGSDTATVRIVVTGPTVPPVAEDDSYSTPQDSALSVPAPGVLGNDTLNLGSISAADATSGQGGTVVLAGTGGFTYTPPTGFVGFDTFTYTLTNLFGSDSATVTVAVGDLPDAVDDSYATGLDDVLLIPAPGVLANDTLNTATISAFDATSSQGGTVNLNPDGSFSYTPPAGFQGEDSFTYTLTNALGSDSATVTILVLDPPDAVDDSYATQLDTPLTVAAPGVLANDTVNLATISTYDATTLAGGTVVLAPDGSFSYTPPSGFNGDDAFSYTLTNAAGSDTATVTIGINAAPLAVDDAFTTLEDTPLSGNVLGDNGSGPDSDADGDTLTVAEVAGSAANVGVPLTLPSGASLTINSDGTFSYTPAADDNGTDTFTYRVTDGQVLSNLATVTISITPVNDAPSFAAGPDVVVAEDAGAQTIDPWATAISAGPADESGQSLTFQVVGNTNAGLFSAGPAVSPSGVLTFTPTAEASGAATITLQLVDDGGTANGGSDTSPTQTFTITVGSVNDAPSFTAGPDQVVLEDAGAQTVDPWATDISAGPPDEAGQALTFQITANTNPALFSAGPAVSATGVLTFTPAPDANGSATITLVLTDDGGTAGGGVDTSAEQSFTITVTPVNDAPSFTVGPDVTVAEDAGAQTIDPWATGIAAGPPDESGQALAFQIVGNTNPELFSAGPSVSPSGELTFTPVANASGSAEITLQLVDDGGTANGGADTSPTQTFTITVSSVNDPPVAEDQTLSTAEDTPVDGQVVASDVDGDALTFTLQTPASSGQAVVNADGSFTYTPNPDFNGSDSFVVLVEDGNGGSDSATISLTVGAVNDAPSFDLPTDPDQTVVNTAGAQSVPGFATSISAGPPDESGQTLTFQVTTDNAALFSVPPAIDATTGTLTYTPNASASGVATVTVVLQDDGGTANGGDDTSDPQTFTITVSPPNQAPVAADLTATTSEDTAVTITLSATDADGDALTFGIVAAPGTGTLGGIANLTCDGNTPSSCTAQVTYTPGLNVNGADSFTYQADDGQGTNNLSNEATVAITVNPVNDPPSFVVGADQTVLEDGGTTTVSGWASAISAGPTADEASQTLTFTVSNDNTALFSTQPAISAAGELTFSVAANAFGTATVTVTLADNGGTANGGDDTSDAQTFTITVTAVNDAPSFTAGGDVTVNEDSGAYSAAWATAISAGPNEAGQTLTFTVSAGDPSLFSVQPAISPSGVLAFTPAANASGTTTLTVTLADDGGTANGGDDTSDAQTFTITITAINDPPSFTAANPPAVLEDAGAQTVTGWVTSVSTGPANESGQTILGYTVSNVQAVSTLSFAVPPAVAADGTLSYTAAADAYGTATFDVVVQDSGGTANGGDDTADPQTFTLTVTPVNDAPSFTTQGSHTSNEDAGAVSVAGFVTSFNPGPGEADSVDHYEITNNDNTALFSVQPAIAANGTLTYTAAPDQNGTATLTVRVVDTGGTANGGVNTSPTQTFTITVTAINDPPVVDGDNIRAYTARASLRLTIDAAGGLLSNVVDKPNETGAPFSMRFGGTPVTAQTVVALTGGHTLTVETSGAFTFDPAAGFTGTASFTYEVCDSGTGTPASACQTVTVNVTVEGPVVFFVDDIAGSGGTGTLLNPFRNLTELNGRPTPTPANATVIIFVFEGSYSGTITLKDTELLLGQGAFANGTSFVAGVNTYLNPDITAPPAGSQAYPGFSGTRPALTATSSIVLANSNVVDGINVAASSGAAITASNKGGTTVLDEITLTTSGSGAGLSLSGQGGALTATNLAINANSSGAALNLDGGNGTVSLNNVDVDQDGSGRVVSIVNRNVAPANTVTFNNNSAVTASNGQGVVLTGNTQATITFQGGVQLTTDSDNAFTATGGGTVEVTGTDNTLNTTTGTALNVTSTTIGAAGLTFRRIDVSGNGSAPTNGVVLNSTGSTAGLTVSGNSSGLCGGQVGSGPPAAQATATAPNTADCTGGVIQNTSGAGMVLTSTRDVSLTRMRIAGADNDGIQGTSVTNFSLTASLIENNGNAVGEGNIDFGDRNDITPDGLFGVASITNSTIRGAFERNVSVRNQNNTLTSFTVTGSQFSNNSANLESDDGLFFDAVQTASMTISVTGSYFAANRGDHFQTAASNSASLNVTFKNNTLTGGHTTALGQGITINAATGVAFGGYTGRVDYDIDGNNIQGAILNGITTNLGTSGAGGVFDGFIRNNVIGAAGVALSCSTQGSGIAVDAHGNGTHTVAVTGNTIRRCFDRGIFVLANDGNGVLNLTVTGNSINTLSDTDAAQGTPREAFNLVAGATSTNVFGQIDSHAVCLNLTSTNGNMVGGAFKNGDIRVRQRFRASIRLPGYAGTPFNDVAVINFIQGNNPGTTATVTVNDDPTVTTDGFFGGAACAQPTGP